MCTVRLPPCVNPIAVNKYININIKLAKCAYTGLEVDAVLWRAGWESSGDLCASRINCFSLHHESPFHLYNSYLLLSLSLSLSIYIYIYIYVSLSLSMSLSRSAPPLSLSLCLARSLSVLSYLKGLKYVAFWRCFMIYYLRRISKQITFPQCSARSNIPPFKFLFKHQRFVVSPVYLLCAKPHAWPIQCNVTFDLSSKYKTQWALSLYHVKLHSAARHACIPTEVESRFKNLWTGTTVCFKIKFFIVTVWSFILEGQKF